MKFLLIKTCLIQYDIGKGYMRILKDEPHILRLREFYQELGGDKALNRDLNANELFNLVRIALGKKNWNESGSAKTFSELFNALGGKEAYLYLEEKKCLTPDTVAFLEQYAPGRTNEEIKGLAVLAYYAGQSVPPLALHALSGVAPSLDLVSISSKTTCLTTLKKEGLLSKAALLLVARIKNVSIAEKLIRLMNDRGLFNDTNLSLVAENPDAAEPLLAILLSLGKKAIFSDDFCDSQRIIGLSAIPAANLSLYLGIIEQQCEKNNTMASRDVSTQLLANHEILAKQNTLTIRKILKVVLDKGWFVADFLHYFFEIDQLILLDTMTHMTDVLPDVRYLAPVLDAIKTSPQHHGVIIKGVYQLEEDKLLDEANLQFILSSCTNAHTLAKALNQWTVFARQAPTLKEILPQKKLPYFSPYAEKIMDVLMCLQKIVGFDEKICTAVTDNRQYAEFAMKILPLLKRVTLCSFPIITLLYSTHMMNQAAFEAFLALEKADILTKANIVRLCVSSYYIKTLASACTTLSNAVISDAKGLHTKLTQTTFESLLKEPLDALKLAESLGGRLAPSEPLEMMQDVRACHYVNTRKRAAMLGHLQRKGALFGIYVPPMIRSGKKQPMTPQERYDLERKFVLERQNLEKKSVLHIAKFLGDGIFLEKETEDKVAEETIEAIFKTSTP